MKKKRLKIKKGQYGYVHDRKIKQTWITIGLIIAPLLVFFTGLYINRTRNTIVTVVSVVACLPACKSAVTAIMLYLQTPMKEEEYLAIKAHTKDLTTGFELIISAYEKHTFIDSLTVCGNTIVGYSSRKKTDIPFIEKHIRTILKENGFSVSVKIFKELNLYLHRLDDIQKHSKSLEQGIKFTPNETYPDLSRNEVILHTIYAISL